MRSDRQKKESVKILANELHRAINDDPLIIAAIQQIRELGYEPNLKIRLRAVEREADEPTLSLPKSEFSETDRKILNCMLISAD